MEREKTKVVQKDSNQVAESHFKHDRKNNANEAVKGIAETHQQVADQYFEGTVDQKFK